MLAVMHGDHVAFWLRHRVSEGDILGAAVLLKPNMEPFRGDTGTPSAPAGDGDLIQCYGCYEAFDWQKAIHLACARVVR